MARESATESHSPAAPSGTPAGKSCAFKEWSLVCDALGAGDQSIILRKGGIHEGKEGFWWRHSRFYLFPTHFHEQAEQFHWVPGIDGNHGPPPEDCHVIRLYAEVDFKVQITDWKRLEQLQPFHHWSAHTLRERFDYTGNQGISLAFLRVWRLAPSWVIPASPSYGGCRSWLTLPAAPANQSMKPVLTDAEHEARRTVIQAVVSLRDESEAG